MSRGSYTISHNDGDLGVKKIKNFKDFFLLKRFLSNTIDDNDIIIDMPDDQINKNSININNVNDTCLNLPNADNNVEIEQNHVFKDSINDTDYMNGEVLNEPALDENGDTNYKYKQLLNYFPNNTSKHIDYVIYYKDTPETLNSKEIKKMRIRFFKKLKQEGFDYRKIEHENNDNTKSIYVLLNCSLDRLCDEAERIKIELPLRLVG